MQLTLNLWMISAISLIIIGLLISFLLCVTKSHHCDKCPSCPSCPKCPPNYPSPIPLSPSYKTMRGIMKSTCANEDASQGKEYTNACIGDLFRLYGCSNIADNDKTVTGFTGFYNQSKWSMPQVLNDITLWATETDDHHAETCYGTPW